MPERKVWTEEEDKVLKYLKEVRGVPKWSVISETMEKEFNIVGRNGKQCRQRYHNHLDHRINNSQWTLQQQNKLFQLQDELGNKWALISSRIPGRTDNCVKNHFYSKLRKGLRKLNKKVLKHFKRQYKEIKTETLYRIIENIENKGKANLKAQLDSYQLCKKIKNQIRSLQAHIENYQDQEEQYEFLKHILEDIALFDEEIKKCTKVGRKSSKKQKFQDQDSYSYLSSSKSICDDQQSDMSNSDIISSTSYDLAYRNKNQDLLRPPRACRRSMSIRSNDSEVSQKSTEKHILFKSTKSMSTFKQNPNFPSSLLKPIENLNFPNFLTQTKQKMQKQLVAEQQKVQPPESPAKEKVLECAQESINMMGDQQNFPSFMVLRLFSPKRPTHDDIMEMNGDMEQIFYDQKMEIECDNLIHNFSGLNLNEVPHLGHFDF